MYINTYSKFSNERAERFNIITKIFENKNNQKYVIKSPLSNKSNEHVENIYKFYHLLEKRCERTVIEINHCELNGSDLKLDYIDGVALDKIIDSHIKNNETDKAIEIIKKYIEIIEKIHNDGEFLISEEFENVFGKIKVPKGLVGSKITDIDMIFQNIIVCENSWNVIDYEWTFDFLIPKNYLIYRAFLCYTFDFTEENEQLKQSIFNLVKFSKDELKCYEEMERNFQKYVMGEYVSLDSMYEKMAKKSIEFSDLIEDGQIFSDDLFIQIYFGKEKNFCEENSIIFYKKPKHNGDIEFEFDIAEETEILRLDPGNKKCIVRIDSLYAESEETIELKYITNGYKLKKNFYLFETEDPQIIIESLKENTKKIYVKLNINNSIEDVQSYILGKTINKKSKIFKSKK